MAEVVYRSEVRIEREGGTVRRAYLPSEAQPVFFGVHGAVAMHYKVPPLAHPPHATTLDYIVASAAACVLGSYTAALEARQIPVSGGRITAQAVGEVELEDKVLVLRRIRVSLRLRVDAEDREGATRIHATFLENCPAYRSLRNSIPITTELVLVNENAPAGIKVPS